MGKYFIGSDLYRLAFPDGEWVDLKQEFSQADTDYITAQMLTAKMSTEGKKTPVMEAEMNFGKQATLERAIVAWSFADNGTPILVTPENISNLRSKYRTQILAKVDLLAEQANAFSKN